MITQIDYRSFTWDNTEATIEDVEGVGLEGISDTYSELPQREGSLSTGWRRESRVFGWTTHLQGSSAANYSALRQQLYYYLVPETVEGHTMTFTLYDGTTRTLRYARCIEAPLNLPPDEPSIIWNTYDLVFRADYPYFLGTERSYSQLETSISGGATIPTPVAAPMQALSSTSSGSDPLSATNSGNAPAYPVFTITGPGTGFTISNSTTGSQIYLSSTLTAAQSVTIDTWFRTITRDDGTSLRADFTGDWVFIEGGAAGATNTITFSVDSGATSVTQLETVYNDSYHTL